MNTSVLEQELAPLHTQIEQVQEVLAGLAGEMRAAEAELETFSADRLRFDALRDACDALDRLGKLEAGPLFWGEVPEVRDTAGHLERLRSRIASFDGEIRVVLEKQASLQRQTHQRCEELDYLYDEIHDAHARDERRKDEFVIERELSPVPYHQVVMPWSHEAESERRFRRSTLAAMFCSLLLVSLIHLITVPAPSRLASVIEIPERLAMLVRKEPVKAATTAKHLKVEKKPVAAKLKVKPEEMVPARPGQERSRTAPTETTVARNKAESSGVLAFRDTFEDLMNETPVAKLGVEARVNNDAALAAGQTQASRSLVAMQAGSGGAGSGGISNATVSRNLGSANGSGGGTGRLSGEAGKGGFAQVKSAIAGTGAAAPEAKALSSGAGPARTDEEIQILFDRYKAALYRIYNTELRKDPTLRGKMVLRITIEPSGAVSACSVDSSNLNSSELTTQVVARVNKFNFGPKDGVPTTTILYPIDFLPAG